MLTSFTPLHRDLQGRSCFGCREHKELVVGGRRAEERVEIDQDLYRERGGTGRMVDDQPGLIRENEWVGGFGFATVLAPLIGDFQSLPKGVVRRSR
jgi:hypothetical protein